LHRCTAGKALSALVLALAAGACSTSANLAGPPSDAAQDLRTRYAAFAQAGGAAYQIDPASSSVRIFVFRGGRAPRLGHNHVLAAPKFQGMVFLPAAATSSSDVSAPSWDMRARGARFDLEFRLDELTVDDPAIRSGLGPAFASMLSPEDLQSLREHMLGPDYLQAAQYPFFRVRALELAGESPHFAAKVDLQLHGQDRETWIPLQVEGLPDRISVRGSFVLAQSEFGVQPYSVLGGFIAVDDRIIVEFQLEGKPLAKH